MITMLGISLYWLEEFVVAESGSAVVTNRRSAGK
jgi:hypothetical protein